MRQNIHQENNQKLKAEMKRMEEERFPFKPEINVISRQLVEEGGPVDMNEKVRKLAIMDKEKHDCLIAQLVSQEQNKYSFKPELCKKSEILAKERDPTQLTDWAEREQRRLDRMKVVEVWRMRECKFVPETNKNKRFANLESNYSAKNYDSKMQEYQKRKQIEVALMLICRQKQRRVKQSSKRYKTALSSPDCRRKSKLI